MPRSLIGKQFKKYQKLEVVWLDSNYRSGWASPQAYREFVSDMQKDFIITEIGYFSEWTKDFLVIVGGYDKQEKQNVHHINTIPKSSILEIKVLRE